MPTVGRRPLSIPRPGTAAQNEVRFKQVSSGTLIRLDLALNLAPYKTEGFLLEGKDYTLGKDMLGLDKH